MAVVVDCTALDFDETVDALETSVNTTDLSVDERHVLDVDDATDDGIVDVNSDALGLDFGEPTNGLGVGNFVVGFGGGVGNVVVVVAGFGWGVGNIGVGFGVGDLVVGIGVGSGVATQNYQRKATSLFSIQTGTSETTGRLYAIRKHVSVVCWGTMCFTRITTALTSMTNSCIEAWYGTYSSELK